MENDLTWYTRKKSKAYQKVERDSHEFYARADKNLKNMFTHLFKAIIREDKEKYDLDSKLKLLRDRPAHEHGSFVNTSPVQVSHTMSAAHDLLDPQKSMNFNKRSLRSANFTMDEQQVVPIMNAFKNKERRSFVIEGDTIVVKNTCNEKMFNKSMNFSNRNNLALMTLIPLPVETEKELEHTVNQTNETLISFHSVCNELKNSLICSGHNLNVNLAVNVGRNNNNGRQGSFLALNSNRSGNGCVTNMNGSINMNDVSFRKSTQRVKNGGGGENAVNNSTNISSPKHENVRTIIEGEIGIIKDTTIDNNDNVHHSNNNNNITDDVKDIILNEQKKAIEHEPITVKEYKYRKYLKTIFNVYDSLSDTEIIDDSTYPYINPTSYTKTFIDGLILTTTLFFMCFSPIELAFFFAFKSYPLSLLFPNFIGEVLYIIDFFCGFFTAFYDKVDHLQNTPYTIIIHYLSSWCALDFLTAIPISSFINIYLMISSSSNFYIQSYTTLAFSHMKFIHCFKLVKLLKICKVSFANNVTTIIFDKAVHSPMGRSLLLYVTVFTFLATLHVMACFFIFLGYNNYPSWITVLNYKIKAYTTIYFASIYYIMLTIVGVGYGDILSTNYSERGFSIFLLAIGVLVYSWFVSAFAKYREESFVSGGKADECLKKLDYLETLNETYKNIPVSLYNRIYRYLLFNFQKEKFSLDIIFESLPTTLQRDLLFAMYRPIVKRFVFFKYFDNEDFIMKILTCLKRSYFLRNERLIHKGDFVEEMLFVQKGKLALELPLPLDLSNELLRSSGKISKYTFTMTLHGGNTFRNKSKKRHRENIQQYIKLIEIRANEHYGDLSIFLNQRSILSVRVSSRSAQLFYLKKADAFAISSQFPEIWRIIIINSIYNMKQINMLIKRTILFFYESNQKLVDVLLKQNNNYQEEMNNKETELLKQAIVTTQKIEVDKGDYDDDEKYYDEENRQLNIISEASAAGLLSSDNEQVMLEEERKNRSNLVQRTRISGKTLPKMSVKLNFNFKKSTCSNNNELSNLKEENDTKVEEEKCEDENDTTCIIDINNNNNDVSGDKCENNNNNNSNNNVVQGLMHKRELLEINCELEQGEYLQVQPMKNRNAYANNVPITVDSFFDKKPPQQQQQQDNTTNNATTASNVDEPNDFFFLNKNNSSSKMINNSLLAQNNNNNTNNNGNYTSLGLISPHAYSSMSNTKQHSAFTCDEFLNKNKTPKLGKDVTKRSFKPDFDFFSAARSTRTNAKKYGQATQIEKKVSRKELQVNMNQTGIAEFDTSLKLVIPTKFHTSKGLLQLTEVKGRKKEIHSNMNASVNRVSLITNNIEQNIQNLSNPEKFYESTFLDMISNEGKGKINKMKNGVSNHHNSSGNVNKNNNNKNDHIKVQSITYNVRP